MSEWGGPAAFILLGLVLIVATCASAGARTSRTSGCRRGAAKPRVVATPLSPPRRRGGAERAATRRLRSLYLRLKYFSRSSSDIERTTGPAVRAGEPVARLRPVRDEVADLLRREVIADRHGRAARQARGEAVAPERLVGGARFGERAERHPQRLGRIALGRLGGERGDRVGPSRHRLDLEAGGRRGRRSSTRASRPPPAWPRRARAAGASATARGPTRCGRGSARRAFARAPRAGRSRGALPDRSRG